MVVKGKCDPDLPFFTVGGSFWINGALRLEESGFPEVCPSRHIGRCAARRYESIAAIPLKNGKEIIGLLQLCDSHGDAFAEDLIEFFEGIGASIGIALGRRQSREALRIKDLAIDTSLNAMAIASPEGILTYANPAFVRLFEYENEAEIIGKSAQSFWEDRNLAKKAAKEILNKQSWEGT